MNVDFFARGECLMIIGIGNYNGFFSGCNAWVELFFSEMFLENKQSLSFTCFNARLSLMLHQRKKIFWVAPELFSMKKGRPGWYFRNTNLGFQLNKQSKLDPTQTTPLLLCLLNPQKVVASCIGYDLFIVLRISGVICKASCIFFVILEAFLC